MPPGVAWDRVSEYATPTLLHILQSPDTVSKEAGEKFDRVPYMPDTQDAEGLAALIANILSVLPGDTKLPRTRWLLATLRTGVPTVGIAMGCACGHAHANDSRQQQRVGLRL